MAITTAATITRHPGPLYEEVGQWAYDVVAGDAFVIQWLTVREDVAGDEVLLGHVLRDTGWDVAGPIRASGEATWSVQLVAAD